MVYLIIIILLSSSIFVCFRLFNNFKVDNRIAITVNYSVAAIGGYMISPIPFSVERVYNSPWFFSSIIVGILFTLGFYLFALSNQKAGVAITAVSSKMSVILPVSLGVFLLGEEIHWTKGFGIVLALLSLYLSLKKKREEKDPSMSKWVFFLPVLIFITSGTIDSSLKFAIHEYVTNDYILYLSTIFASALVCGTIFSFSRKSSVSKINLHSVIGGIVLGVLNFSNCYFMLRAMDIFDSSVQFPTQNIGIVVLSSMIGLIIFKEKLSKTNWIGIGLSSLAITLISLP